jgi:hypothetical protein
MLLKKYPFSIKKIFSKRKHNSKQNNNGDIKKEKFLPQKINFKDSTSKVPVDWRRGIEDKK